ncbi:MAG: adenine phosphoribosyltransferase [Cyanobacteria bacterium HKST-UBA04]|nr:adenine phosphoribosyltransferase [Cyanobacteria bacterium HKST-UBA04]MCA9842638.1 adenine phosphoribosyltransferase [Cyanobacteria bacterium HKST-UBA03]
MTTSPAPLKPEALETIKRVRDAIRSIPDFPKPGILFRDFTPILADHTLFDITLAWFEYHLKQQNVDYIVGIESRGFIVGAALAHKMDIGFVPARKKGKLPGDVVSYEYELEYGTDTIQMVKGAMPTGSRVAVVDDLLATGGTANATIQLCRKIDVTVVAALFMMELTFLNGRNALPQEIPIHTMVPYHDETP